MPSPTSNSFAIFQQKFSDHFKLTEKEKGKAKTEEPNEASLLSGGNSRQENTTMGIQTDWAKVPDPTDKQYSQKASSEIECKRLRIIFSIKSYRTTARRRH
jgi:hypothetical protein